MARIEKLDCRACGGERVMERTKAPRFGLGIRLIGVLIAAPSAIGAAFGAMIVWATITAHHDVAMRAVTEAERSGAAIGAGIGLVTGLGIIAASLVGGIIGWLILSRRKVWRCTRCGSVIDRA